MADETATEQAPEASVEERIGNLFGSSESSEEPEAATPEAEASEETAPETFEVEIDGAKYTLPKALEKSFMQERDYTQKSQELASTRRSLEFEQQAARIANLEQGFAKETAPQRQEITMLEAVIKQAQGQDWSQMPTDELIRKRLELDSLKDRKSSLEQEIQGKRQQWEQATAAQLQQLKDSAIEVIKKRIPGYNEQVQAEIRAAALADGYTEAELSAIFSPKHAITLWKASQFDKLSKAAKPTPQKGAPIKTTPTSQMPKSVQAELTYRKELGKVQRGSQEHQRLVAKRIGDIFG